MFTQETPQDFVPQAFPPADATGYEGAAVAAALNVPAGSPGGKNRIYVKSLPKSMRQEHFSMMFSQFGSIIECNFFAASDEEGSKGYGFVAFNNPIDAENCVDVLGGKTYAWMGESGVLTPDYKTEEGSVEMELLESLNKAAGSVGSGSSMNAAAAEFTPGLGTTGTSGLSADVKPFYPA